MESPAEKRNSGETTHATTRRSATQKHNKTLSTVAPKIFHVAAGLWTGSAMCGACTCSPYRCDRCNMEPLGIANICCSFSVKWPFWTCYTTQRSLKKWSVMGGGIAERLKRRLPGKSGGSQHAAAHPAREEDAFGIPLPNTAPYHCKPQKRTIGVRGSIIALGF